METITKIGGNFPGLSWITSFERVYFSLSANRNELKNAIALGKSCKIAKKIESKNSFLLF